MTGRRHYDEETKRQAIKYAALMGEAQAAAEFGIPHGTIMSWMTRYKQAGASMTPTRTLDGGEMVRGRPVISKPDDQPWADRSTRLADNLGSVVEQAIATAQAYLTEGRTAEALNAIKIMATAVEKAQLLSGQATSRGEVRSFELSGSVRELQEFLDEIQRNDMKQQTCGLVIPADTVDEQGERSDDH